MVDNMAAWQPTPGVALQIARFEHPPLADREVLVRNGAVAINPLDVHLHETAFLPWVTYPAILGTDVAGEVAAIGAGVTRLKVGDRVLGLAVGTSINRPAHGGYQQHTVLLENMVCRIPDAMAFEDAAVLPHGLGTAACGLYQEDNLGLEPPSLSPVRQDRAVLVWGASSSVGCNAVQLAVASGYEVVAVASPAHAELLLGLGAREVLDYRDPDVVRRTVTALQGRTLAGALHAKGNVNDTFAVVGRCAGRRRVANSWFPPDMIPDGVENTFIQGVSLKDDDLGERIYGEFLPAALAAGRYRAAPPARVVGTGLEALQTALELKQRGVSGVKLVVGLR